MREQARIAFAFFDKDPNDPGLMFKRLKGFRHPYYSARVGDNHRALCLLHGDTAIWFFIGTHDEYERVIAGLA